MPLVVARQSLRRVHDDIKVLREDDFRASLLLGRLRDRLADVRSRELAVGTTDSLRI